MSDLSERLRAAHATCIRDGWHGPEILLEAAVAASCLDYLASVEGRRDWLEALEAISMADLANVGGDSYAWQSRGTTPVHRFLHSPPEVQAAVCRLVDAKLESKRHD